MRRPKARKKFTKREENLRQRKSKPEENEFFDDDVEELCLDL